MSLLEVLVPAVLGGPDWPIVIGWVIVAALVITMGFVVYLALGPGTQPYQGEDAEPTPTDESPIGDSDTEEGSDAATGSGSSSH